MAGDPRRSLSELGMKGALALRAGDDGLKAES
jgi:hypothetical protein